MKDLIDILDAYQKLDGRAALATVVKVIGSTYRRPGARLLVRNDGSTVGTISGGCLEGEVVEKAKKLMSGENPQLAVFDMTGEDDDLWGYGQGCNGVIHVFIEPLDSVKISRQLQFIQRCHNERTTGTIATVIRVEGELKVTVGARMFLTSKGIEETIRHPVVSASVAEEAQSLFKKGTFGSKEFRFTDGVAEVFFEIVHPPLALIIAGAGSNAKPVVQFASRLGWQVTVVDHRPALATRGRFPEARAVFACRPEELSEQLSVDKRTAAVIMTHQFQIDLALLRYFLSNDVLRYVGLLGNRKRTDLLFQKLEEDEFVMSPERRSRVFGPVGLDVGAESPEEIALAIIAEIQTVFSGRRGGSMRERLSPLH